MSETIDFTFDCLQTFRATTEEVSGIFEVVLDDTQASLCSTLEEHSVPPEVIPDVVEASSSGFAVTPRGSFQDPRGTMTSVFLAAPCAEDSAAFPSEILEPGFHSMPSLEASRFKISRASPTIARAASASVTALPPSTHTHFARIRLCKSRSDSHSDRFPL